MATPQTLESDFSGSLLSPSKINVDQYISLKCYVFIYLNLAEK